MRISSFCFFFLYSNLNYHLKTKSIICPKIWKKCSLDKNFPIWTSDFHILVNWVICCILNENEKKYGRAYIIVQALQFQEGKNVQKTVFYLFYGLWRQWIHNINRKDHLIRYRYEEICYHAPSSYFVNLKPV